MSSLPRSKPSSPSEGNLLTIRNVPCKFFAAGTCKYGRECRFAHLSDYDPTSLGGLQPGATECKFFANGRCRFGNTCSFLHTLQAYSKQKLRRPAMSASNWSWSPSQEIVVRWDAPINMIPEVVQKAKRLSNPPMYVTSESFSPVDQLERLRQALAPHYTQTMQSGFQRTCAFTLSPDREWAIFSESITGLGGYKMVTATLFELRSLKRHLMHTYEWQQSAILSVLPVHSSFAPLPKGQLISFADSKQHSWHSAVLLVQSVGLGSDAFRSESLFSFLSPTPAQFDAVQASLSEALDYVSGTGGEGPIRILTEYLVGAPESF